MTFTEDSVLLEQWVVDWGEQEKLHPINWKETKMAAETLHNITEYVENVEIVTAVDNTTARASLRHAMYVEDAVMSGLLDALETKMKSKGILLTVVQVRSAEMMGGRSLEGCSFLSGEMQDLHRENEGATPGIHFFCSGITTLRDSEKEEVAVGVSRRKAS